MKLDGLDKYKDLHELILTKIDLFGKNPTQFSTLFELMFSEKNNVMVETMVGYKINKTTYGEVKDSALRLATSLKRLFSTIEKNSIIGLDMPNGIPWIVSFWAILIAGYKPLLINSRLPRSVIEEVISNHQVKAVLSDGTKYSSCNTYIYSEISTDNILDTSSSGFGEEVIFMSSGTQGDVKLCAYTSERFYYQICDTFYIVKDCPQIRKGFEGKIKQLALLPFYHVFGFMAVYLWFGFFSRTFVFLKDLAPQTLLNTVRRHKVTHIFAVPLVWETIYKTVINTIKSRGEKVVKKFEKGLRLAKSGKLGKKLVHGAFSEIREQIFGDSVQFLISGGSSVDQKAVEFFNAIGYHLANGYGMTEIGITSVELSLSDKERNSLSIGTPLRHAEYKVENGTLYVKSNTRATRILYRDQEVISDFDEWFDTKDLATFSKGKYFIGGRSDDLLVGESGENLNPNIIEKLLLVDGVFDLCLFPDSNGATTLLASCPKVYTIDQFKDIRKKLEDKIREHGLDGEIKSIQLTSSPLMDATEFKVSRKKVAKRYKDNQFAIISMESFSQSQSNPLQEKIKALFAKVLQKDISDIGVDESFFSSLGGNSLDYFTLIELIKAEIGVQVPVDEAQKLSTVRAFEEYVQRSNL